MSFLLAVLLFVVPIEAIQTPKSSPKKYEWRLITSEVFPEGISTIFPVTFVWSTEVSGWSCRVIYDDTFNDGSPKTVSVEARQLEPIKKETGGFLASMKRPTIVKGDKIIQKGNREFDRHCLKATPTLPKEVKELAPSFFARRP